MDALTFGLTEVVLLAAIELLMLIQLIYQFALYHRLVRYSRTVEKEEVHFADRPVPISVILSAYEEPENLRRNLRSILQQDYPQFEVIVVGYGDTAETEDLLIQLEAQYPNLYHSVVPESSRYISRKKLALTLGIRASKYDWLVLTEADCHPQTDQWLHHVARNFTSHADVVLGYSSPDYKKGWLQKCVTFDNLLLHIRYLSLALCGHPYMGIGRNLAYRKEMFFEHKGFSDHLNLQRGDDDLFVNTVANRQNTRIEISPEARVGRQPLERGKQWREEKISYASTSRLYHGMQRHLLGFDTLTRLAFYAACIGTIVWGCLQSHWLTAAIALAVWMLRTALQAMVINQAARVLGEQRRYYLSLPLFEVLQPLWSLYGKLGYLLRDKQEFLRK